MKTINLRFSALLCFAVPLAVFGAGAFAASHTTATAVAPSTMPRIGKVDERYLSYNIEMLEVTGGQFWKPYKSQSASANSPGNASSSSVPAGMSPDLYQYRAPIDLANARRRKLAAALGPAYVRISGTWANSTYFQDSDDSPQKPPAGFHGVLTRSQ